MMYKMYAGQTCFNYILSFLILHINIPLMDSVAKSV